MGLLYPAFLLAAVAIAIPIALHLLRRDVAPDVPFTAVRLLKRSPVDRSRRRRLRDLLLLAARVAALLLLALAFARPFVPGSGSAMMPLRVVAVDRSFSMGAPGQFERARALARAAVDEATFGERVAVVAFDDRAEVLAPPGSRQDARQAIDRLAVGHGGTRYAAALSKAAELATGGPVRLVLVTDLQRAGWEGESRVRLPSSIDVEIRDTGIAAANAAIVAARLTDGALVASIRNAAAAPRQGQIVLTHDGAEAARASYSLEPGASADVPLAWKASAGSIVLTIDDPDGFPADNARHLVVGPALTPEVLVVTSAEAPGFYLQRALHAAADSGEEALAARLVTPAEIAGGRAAAIQRHRAVVLLTTRSLDRTAREALTAFVTGGGGLMIAAAPDVEPDVIATMFGWSGSALSADGEPRRASLAATDIRHPIFRPFGALATNLGNVRFTRAWRVAPDGWHVAARFDDGAPALLERTHGEGRIVLFASDLDRRWNDFPLHPAFVPFVVEAVRHVAARAAEPDLFVVGRVPPGVGAEPGVHRLESGRLVAVNVDPRESSTAVLTAEEFAAMIEQVEASPLSRAAEAEQIESRQSLWQYGLLLMLAVLVVESFVGRGN
ncbi:MAG TPA: VWA domain-containing protein [Vicinamibacterales bacterium]|nr:VWA domain-containing protein [Vicinamibacterales bacterium]